MAGRAKLYGIVPQVPMEIELTGSDAAVEKFIVRLVPNIPVPPPSPPTTPVVDTSTSAEVSQPTSSSSTTTTMTTSSTSQAPSTTTQPVTSKPVEPTKGIITVDTGDKSTSGSAKLMTSVLVVACLSSVMA